MQRMASVAAMERAREKVVVAMEEVVAVEKGRAREKVVVAMEAGENVNVMERVKKEAVREVVAVEEKEEAAMVKVVVKEVAMVKVVVKEVAVEKEKERANASVMEKAREREVVAVEEKEAAMVKVVAMEAKEVVIRCPRKPS